MARPLFERVSQDVFTDQRRAARLLVIVTSFRKAGRWCSSDGTEQPNRPRLTFEPARPVSCTPGGAVWSGRAWVAYAQ